MNNTNNLFFGLDFNPESNEPINFLENRFMDLSPFSAHQVTVWDETFATAEHAYQAARIKPGPEREVIKNATSPMNAWREGQKYKNTSLLVDDFNKDALMEEIFRAKLDQHDDVKQVLLMSKDRELLKVYDVDYYWGTGADMTGENKMGKLWIKLRDEPQNKNS